MKLKPSDHAEKVALFRAQLLGPVLCTDLQRGELMATLRTLAERRYRPPGSDTTRSYSVPTLRRWRRRYLRDGLAGLRPDSRRIGDALGLSADQRELVLEIRRQHPSVPANVVLETLEGSGRLAAGALTAQTLRRLYRHEQLPRTARNKANRPEGERRRWEAPYPGNLWHADVCHGEALKVDGRRIPVRVHALLDDKSRFIVALRVLNHEREIGMLDLLLEAIRRHGAPRRLYLDNGSTYRGEALATACGRLGIALSHAQAYDPQARGKMERFWRTLRQGCLDHLGAQASLHAVDVRLNAFVSEKYHKAAHAGLIGASPATVWKDRQLKTLSESELAAALTVRETRLVARDCTVRIGNMTWELDAAFLAGKRVLVGRALTHPQATPWVEYEGVRHLLRPVDPVANGKQHKRRKPKPGIDAVDFDPGTVWLHRALRRPTPEVRRENS